LTLLKKIADHAAVIRCFRLPPSLSFGGRSRPPRYDTSSLDREAAVVLLPRL